jgi:hypothetical protein
LFFESFKKNIKSTHEKLWAFLPGVVLILFMIGNFPPTLELMKAYPELPLLPLTILGITPTLFVVMIFFIRVKQNLRE